MVGDPFDSLRWSILKDREPVRQMARADLLKKLFTGYQRRDDQAFKQAAEELIVEERKKQHSILANELERILRNGHAEQGTLKRFVLPEPGPTDSECEWH